MSTITAETEPAELLVRLLRGHRYRSPAGTWVHAERQGRLFVWLWADRLSRHPWSLEVEAVACSIGHDLGYLMAVRLNSSSISGPDMWYAPRGAAAFLLEALLAADAGNLDPARRAAAVIHEAVEPIKVSLRVKAKQRAAAGAMAVIEAELSSTARSEDLPRQPAGPAPGACT